MPTRRSAFSHDTYPSSLGVAALLIAPMPSDETGAPSEDLRRLSAVVTALQLQAQTQGPESVVSVGHAEAESVEVPILASHATWSAHPLTGSRNRFEFLLLLSMLLVGIGFGFALGSYFHRTPIPFQEASEALNIDAVVEQIISVESNGDPNAKNKRSSAMGLGQFLDETWLVLIRAHRPDLAKGRSEGDMLELRRDASVARELTTRFTERNAHVLRKRGLPVTPGNFTWPTLPELRERSRSFRRWRKPMRPQPWRAQTRRGEPNERSSLKRTRSLNALRSPILKIGLTARCASVARSRARKWVTWTHVWNL